MTLAASPASAVPATAPRDGVLLAGLTPGTSFSELTVAHWSTDEGLPARTLTNALQTRDGYLWLASFNGLVRFDGLRLTVFDQRSVPPLPVNGVHALAEAAGGELWIGTQGAGVAVYRQGRFDRLPAIREPRVTVRKILLEDDGSVWVGTNDYGAYRYEDGRWQAAGHPALAGVTVRDVLSDRDGAVWFATEGNGAVRFADGDFTAYGAADGLAGVAATSLCETADGVLWVGTEEGLSRFAEERFESVPALAGVEIYRLHRDDYDNLWVAAEQGLIRRNARSGAFEHLERLGGHSLQSLSAVVFGREGELWLASYFDGLYRLQKGKLRSYTPESGLGTERVSAVSEGTRGEILIGGDGGRIDVLLGGALSRSEIAGPLPDVRVRDILQDRRGRWWIATYAGLLEITAGRKVLHTTDRGLPSNQVRLVYEDRAGRIWIGTRNAGLVEVAGSGEPPAGRVVDKRAGLRSDFVLALDEGPEDELLIGTYEGLGVLSASGSVTTYGPAEGLPGSIVFSSFVDRDGAVWLATNGGLARLYGGGIQALTASQGLPADSVFDYVEDGLGFAWLSSAIGVIQVEKQQLIDVLANERPAIEARVYDERDGMASRDCTGAAKVLRASDGRLWFPTLGGLSVVDPAHLPINPVPPPVVISRFAVDGEPIDLHARSHSPLELAAGKKDFAFAFAALSFLAPSRVEVRYRLVGFDDDWVAAGRERNVRYTNLPHGDYGFRVIAANDDGVWNRQGATLRFRVEPFFYQRIWFLAVAAALVAAGLGGLYHWRTRAVRTRQKFLESIIARQRATERENRRFIEELELKNAELERFTYTVSHDLRSPLVTIKGFLGFLEKDAARGNLDRLRSDVRRIAAATDRMNRLLEDVLELSRIGRVINTPQEVALRELAGEARDQLAGAIAASGAEVHIAPDLPTVLGDRPRLVEVYQNLIENAIKHCGPTRSPRIEIGWNQDGSQPVFHVRDDGPGIESRYHDTVFGLFERLDADAEGTGVGLALVKRIIEVHGGRIWIESDGPDTGTTFRFTIPRQEPAMPGAAKPLL